MKVCTACGETYRDYIDFCFNDGEILVAQGAAADVATGASLDAPPAPRMAQGEQAQDTEERLVQPTRSATPTPRAKRSLLNRPASEDVTEAYTAPVPDPAPRASQPTLIPGADSADDEVVAPPSDAAPFSQADTIPIPRRTATPTPGGVRSPRAPVAADASFEEEEGPSKVLLVSVVGIALVLLVSGSGMIIAGLGLLNTSMVQSSSTHEVGSKVVPATPEPADARVAEVRGVETPGEGEGEDEERVGAAEPADEPEEPEEPEDDPEEPADAPAPADKTPAPAPDVADTQMAKAAAPKPAPAVEAAPPESPAKKVGTVRIRSNPSGAAALIGGNQVGLTPVQVELPVGTHEVTLELSGHEPLTQSIEVEAGEAELPAWALAPKGASESGERVPVMIFYAGRIGDDLYVDGALVGKLPTRLELTEGPHRFEVKGPSGDDFASTREVVGQDGGVSFIHLSQ